MLSGKTSEAGARGPDAEASQGTLDRGRGLGCGEPGGAQANRRRPRRAAAAALTRSELSRPDRTFFFSIFFSSQPLCGVRERVGWGGWGFFSLPGRRSCGSVQKGGRERWGDGVFQEHPCRRFCVPRTCAEDKIRNISNDGRPLVWRSSRARARRGSRSVVDRDASDASCHGRKRGEREKRS